MEQLGVPIPSVPVLLTAGTLSATHRLHASYALADVVSACLIADSLWFYMGRRYGGAVLRLLCRFSLGSIDLRREDGRVLHAEGAGDVALCQVHSRTLDSGGTDCRANRYAV